MDGFIDFLASINKIALLAFFVVLGFLIFEIKKMIDEKKKKSIPVIPQFNNTIPMQQAPALNSTPLPPPAQAQNAHTQAKINNAVIPIIIGVISLIGVILLMILSFKTDLKKKQVTATSLPIVREIQSAGIKIFNTHWVEIEANGKVQTKQGDMVYVGIQTIVEADIDRARIKINSDEWQIADITTLFNQQHKVYYKEYSIATGTAQLKIEAELHSASDGWLGE